MVSLVVEAVTVVVVELVVLDALDRKVAVLNEDIVADFEGMCVSIACKHSTN